MASLGGVFSVTQRMHVGLQSRARAHLWSADKKFVTLELPLMDFSAGPALGYSGPLDVMAYGGVAGLMMKSPSDQPAEHTTLQIGPVAMLGVGGAM